MRALTIVAVAVAVSLLPSLALAQGDVVVGQPELPPPPKVDDPMLAPVPPPARVVSSWDQIAAELRGRSADLHVAVQEVARAEAQRREALAGILGSITANGTATLNFITQDSAFVGVDAQGNPTFRTVTSPTPQYLSGNLSFSLPIFAPRAWNSIKTASLGIDIAKASLDDLRRTLASTTASSVLSVATAERVAELNRVGLRNALERLELAKRRLNLGAGTGLDVVRAQSDVEAARATLVSGDESLRQAREALGLALGYAEPVGVAHDVDLQGVVNDVIARCQVAQSVDQRPDVVAARTRVDVAKRSVIDAKSQFLPTLTAQSGISTSTITSQNSPQVTWNLQGVLSWTLWDGGYRYGALHDGEAQVNEAQERLGAARRQALIEVVQSQRAVKVAQQARDIATRARDLADKQDKLTRAGFLTGQGTSLDLVTSAVALRQAEITLALRDFDLVRARVLAVLSLATCPL